MTERFAVYYAPPAAAPLARFGASWLGRDPETGRNEELLPVEGISQELHRNIVRAPGGYGFHATLKPPFALATGTTGKSLEEATGKLASTIAAFDAPPLELASLDGFLALSLTLSCAEMDELAAQCVTELDRFRAPLSEPDWRRHAARGLTERQEELLCRWGYPWVMEHFRFHMTLTGRLEERCRNGIAARLEARLAPLVARRWHVDSICLFHQAAHDHPFNVIRRFPLTGRLRRTVAAVRRGCDTPDDSRNHGS